jgi:hypothetical protein
MPRKVFTAGEVLAAADVNNFLMDQAVMSFAGTAARGSAIPTPVEGMVTYLNDSNALEVYNGAAFVAVAPAPSNPGLEHIITTTFTGVASVSLGSDASPVFSSTYDNYRVVLTTNVSTNANRTFALRLRSNTTDDSSANYGFVNQGLRLDGGEQATNNTGNAQTSAIIQNNAHYSDAGKTWVVSFDIFMPFASRFTAITGMNLGVTAANLIHQSFSAEHAVASSFNGLTILNSSGNFSSGQISVYGYRKA